MYPTSFSPTVSIDNDAKQLARQISMKQLTPQTAKWVYLKILAVLALYQHLIEQQKVEVVLEESNSLDTYGNLIIFIPDIGRIECLPVLPGNQQCLLPDEIVADRIYVAVQFHETPDSVELLGFIPAAEAVEIAQESEQVPLSALKPLDSVLEYLLDPVPEPKAVDLRQWLEGIFDKVWQPIESFWSLQAPTSEVAFEPQGEGCCKETEVYSRGKLIDLGNGGRVVLIISLLVTNDKEFEVVIRVQPVETENLLPSNLELAFLVDGEVWLRNKLEEPKYFLQIEPGLSEHGDRFDIQLAIDNIRLTESFVVGE